MGKHLATVFRDLDSYLGFEPTSASDAAGVFQAGCTLDWLTTPEARFDGALVLDDMLLAVFIDPEDDRLARSDWLRGLAALQATAWRVGAHFSQVRRKAGVPPIREEVSRFVRTLAEGA